MDLLAHAGNIFASAGLLFSSFLGNHQTVLGQSTGPTVTQQQFSSNNYYHMKKSISYEGYNVAVAINVPKNGGSLEGSLSGDCTGAVTGQYAGGDNGAINGQINGTCSALFLQVPFKMTFNGTVDTVTKTAPLQITVNVESIQKTEPVTLSFN